MKISIITPTYNSATTLRDTLDSIQAQAYPHIEHIIVDGASQDETLDICRSYPHVARIHSEPDKGLYDAMNKGIALATGDVVGILNSDDFYRDGQVLSKVAQTLQQHKTQALYGDLQYVDAVDTSKVLRHWKAGPFLPTSFVRGWMPPHPTFFVRRDVYQRLGGFNLQLRYSADYELMLRLLHRFRVSVCYLPEVLVQMRAGGVSNSSLRNRLRANREDRLAWQINHLQPRFYTLYWKPLSKLRQFV